MVNVSHRMTMLSKKLLKLKVGDGAIILPPEVKKIHMDFAIARNEGHAGPRLFWRNELRRIQYYNPSLKVTIARTTNVEDPALMTIFFASPENEKLPVPETSSPKTPEASSSSPKNELTPTTPEKTEIFNIKNRVPSMIMEQLLKLTNATPVAPTAEQLEQLAFLEEYKKLSIKDGKRTIVQNRRLKLEREKDILRKGGLPA